MRLHTPAQLEDLTGLTVGNQRTPSWRTFLGGRGQQSKGGHSRFTDQDVLFVSTVRAIGDKGVDLAVACAVASMCVEEVAAVLTGADPAPFNKSKPFIFVSSMADTPPEWLDAPANSELKEGGRWVHAEKPFTAILTPLRDLNLIPLISMAGGVILIPADIARKIPQAVADLFLVTP